MLCRSVLNIAGHLNMQIFGNVPVAGTSPAKNHSFGCSMDHGDAGTSVSEVTLISTLPCPQSMVTFA